MCITTQPQYVGRYRPSSLGTMAVNTVPESKVTIGGQNILQGPCWWRLYPQSKVGCAALVGRLQPFCSGGWCGYDVTRPEIHASTRGTLE
jgi:hypothetical protein